MRIWLKNTTNFTKKSTQAIPSFDVEKAYLFIFIKEMNIVVRELNTKQNLQDFLLYLLDDVEKYFKAAPPMSEEKAVASIHTIFGKVQKDFPLVAAVSNLAKKLVADIRDKIADRTDKFTQRKKNQGLRSFFQSISHQNTDFNRVNSQESVQNMQNWVKKMLLQSIGELRDDIRQADDKTSQTLAIKLTRSPYEASKLPEIVFVDSFLTNETVISNLNGYKIKRVVQKAKKENEISFEQGAKALRKARFLIISADAILRNGGLIGSSGTLLLAIAAKELGVPVLAITRNYCLWEHVISTQQSLILNQSGRNWFPNEPQNSFRVLIGKRYDYVSPELITGLVGESRSWETKSIVQIFEEYYN